jgi:N-acetylglucosamine-6-phosphate deacetylase
MSLILSGATVLTPDIRFDDAAVLIEDSRIAWCGPRRHLIAPSGATEVDASGLLLAPGLIDLQLNGAFGDDFTADPPSIWRAATLLPRYGVTGFLPTIITSPLHRIAWAQDALCSGRPAGFAGAQPLGLHLEGPFLNPDKKGAHNPSYLRAADASLAATWSPETGVRLVTLAPELPGALEMIRCLTRRGIVVSAGHSMATYEQAQAGFAAGARYGTHLFNAMSPLAHREPGLPGALLATPGQVVGLIPDGTHVHPGLIRVIWAVKGPRETSIVSDAMAALGMAPGTYQLNDSQVIVSERDARLADGTLAGSVLPMDQALRNLVAYTGCTLSDALATVTSTPADLLGVGHLRGRVRAGLSADLVLLAPDLHVVMTIAAGRIVWRAGDRTLPAGKSGTVDAYPRY